MISRYLCALLLAVTGGQLLTRTAAAQAQQAAEAPEPQASIARHLIDAYPGIVTRVDGNAVVFADGTTLPLDDGKGEKTFEAWLADPDIEDMLRQPYPAGAPATAPPRNVDPGRARNHAFFAKVYGDCRSHEVTARLENVVWLPTKSGKTIKVTGTNGVASKLRAVSAELDQLGPAFNVDLLPIGGTYVCRAIAGTNIRSAHGYGIAIDIALKHANYWRWSKPRSDGTIAYQNAIPMEIVAVFEKYGFIWGGRWYHHDTMHFEYRPELLPPSSVPAAAH